MPTFRSKTHSAGVVASTGLLLAQGTAAAFNAADNVAVYWGQNSYNQAEGDLAQQSLADYCANTNIDIIPMSFLVQIETGQGGQPVINLANAGNNCTLFPDSALLDCPQIGEDIKTCQDQYNKTVLLSVGGATYTEGGFASEDAAVKAANLIWETFGPTDSSAANVATNATRPPLTNNVSNSTILTSGGLNRTAPAAAPSPTLDYDPQDPLWAVSLLAKITQTDPASTLITRNSDVVSKTAHPTASHTAKSEKETNQKEVNQKDPNQEDDHQKADNQKDPNQEASHKDKQEAKSTHKPQHQAKQKKSTVYETHTDYASNSRVSTIIDATGTRFIPPGRESTKTEESKSSQATPTNSQERPKIRTVNYDGTHHNSRRQSTALRPFHDAAVDGFDLDIEAPGQNFPAFANRLRELMDAEKAKQVLKTDRNYYLTAAPQCPYPDLNNDAMLNGGVFFDAIFVQFYNNYCGIQSFTPNTTTQTNYNFETWHQWATTNSSNPEVKIFVGVPAGQTAAGSGYTPVGSLAKVIEYSKGFSSFGGVMAWDASQAYANGGFLGGVKEALRSSAAKAKLGKGEKKQGKRRRSVRRGKRQVWWA